MNTRSMRGTAAPVRRASSLFAAGLVFLVFAARALAQEPPSISPPHVRGDAEVLYPAAASGDALVVLEIVVDAEGNPSDVRAVSGPEPFASHAVEAARLWRFDAATKDGKPVSAKMRVQLSFVEPRAPPEPKPSARAETPEAPPPKPAPRAQVEEQIEVTVQGEKSPPVRSLTRAEVRELPGTFGDPFRAIEALPGVTPIISGVPFFFVRGAPPGNVGYFLDGIRVPLLYHIGLGPSVIHPGIVDRVDLHPGGYPARFGRFAGGIVSAEITPPRHDFHGEAQLRLIDAGLLLEGPVAEHRGTVLAAGRYSYTGLMLSLLSPEVVLEYWDYQLRTSWDVSARDTLTLFSFGAFDYLGEKHDDRPTETLFSTEFHRLDLRWDHRASSATSVQLAATVGMDRTRGDDDEFFLRDRLVSVRSEIRHRASKRVVLRAGSDLMLDHYDVQLPPPDPNEDPDGDDDSEVVEALFPPRSDVAIGNWADVVVSPERGVTVTPGLRVDYYASDGASAVGIDPRISARFDVNEKWRLLHALGVAHQPPSFVLPVPGFQIGGLRGGLQRSVQASSGVETEVLEGFTSSLTFFYNAFFDMTDALGAAPRDEDEDGDGEDDDDEIETLTRRSLGSTVGMEIWIRRPLTKKLGGFLSYTLSRSMRSVGREKFPSSFDRTHVLNLALAYDLGRRWRVGSRFLVYTGFPIQNEDGSTLRSRTPDRIPAFWRIDFRIEKRWRLGKSGWWGLALEVLNTTLNKEVVDVDCSGGTCRNDEIGPVTIPSIGAEAAF